MIFNEGVNPFNQFKLNVNDIFFSDISSARYKLSLARFDQFHPYASGNKAFKLLPHVKLAFTEKKSTLLSFGGIYSNHLHALALVGQQAGFKTVGVVRAYDTQPESISVKEMRRAGMEIIKINSDIYRKKNTPAFLEGIKARWPEAHIIPEGGDSSEGIDGAAMMANQLVENFSLPIDYLVISVGTGTTMAGFLKGAQQFDVFKNTQFVGIAAVNDIERMKRSCGAAVPKGLHVDWTIMGDYYLGGFAKINPALCRFMLDFERRNEILLDPVYTAKMLYGVNDLLKNGYFEPESSIVCIHTGGIQGRRGLIDKIQRRALEEP